MAFSETFYFPEEAFADFLAIHDNIRGNPDTENLEALPGWFREEYGISETQDIVRLYDLWDWYELDTLTYNSHIKTMTMAGEGTGSEYALETGVVCDILASVMREHKVPGIITIREDIAGDSELLETGYGGVVHAVSREGHRMLTTDWLAEQMRLERI